jgi:hypothetical protein
MRAIEIVMLCLQAAMVLVVAWTVLMARPKPGLPRPIWPGLGLALVLIASTSFQIADKHHPDAGSRLLEYGSGVLLGMGIMTLLVALRQRLGRDSPA